MKIYVNCIFESAKVECFCDSEGVGPVVLYTFFKISHVSSFVGIQQTAGTERLRRFTDPLVANCQYSNNNK